MNKRNTQIADEIIATAPKKFLDALAASPRPSLGEYHHGFGTWIRNKYNFWKEPWTPEIVDGCDCSPNHPDQRSMTIIELVWDGLQSRSW